MKKFAYLIPAVAHARRLLDMRKSWKAALAGAALALMGLLVAFPIPYAKADDCSTSRSGDRSYTDCYGPDGRSHTTRLCFSDGDCETDSYTEDQP